MWVVVKIMIPWLGTLNIRCRIIISIQKGTIILTTTHVLARVGQQKTDLLGDHPAFQGLGFRVILKTMGPSLVIDSITAPNI